MSPGRLVCFTVQYTYLLQWYNVTSRGHQGPELTPVFSLTNSSRRFFSFFWGRKIFGLHFQSLLKHRDAGHQGFVHTVVNIFIHTLAKSWALLAREDRLFNPFPSFLNPTFSGAEIGALLMTCFYYMNNAASLYMHITGVSLTFWRFRCSESGRFSPHFWVCFWVWIKKKDRLVLRKGLAFIVPVVCQGSFC